MIVDRRKDSYDELMMLSRDSSLDRKRKSQWTTGIVAATVLASGAYVGGTNEHLGNLAEARLMAEQERDDLRREFSRLVDERDALLNEREFYKKSNEWLKELALSANLPSATKDVVNNFAAPPTGVPGQNPPTAISSNLVWIVDGSRRFPMAAADILWVPEGQFWVRMEAPTVAGNKPNRVSIHLGANPKDPADYEVEFTRKPGSSEYLGFYEKDVPPPAAGRGASNCIRLTLHDVSTRPGFSNNRYVDMAVLYREATADEPCEPLEVVIEPNPSNP